MEFGEIGRLAEDILKENKFEFKYENSKIFENMSKEMKNEFETLKMEPDKFEIIGEKGKYELHYDGKLVDIQKASDAMKEGKLFDALKEYKAPEKVLTNLEVIDYTTKYENAWKNQLSIKENTRLSEITENGKKGTEVLGDIKTAEEFNEMVEKNPSVKKAMVELEKKAKEAEKSGKEVETGEWKKTKLAAKALVFAFATGGVYGLIKQHQNDMNGCWLVKTSDGSKCKIRKLTCNPDERTNLCESDYPCVNICTKNQGTCFGVDACTKCKEDESGVQICAETLKECNSGSGCNKCSSDSIVCPDGYFLQCSDVDFLGSMGDFMQQPFEWGADILSKIINVLKIILYIALGIIGLLILFKIGMALKDSLKVEHVSEKSQMKVKK